MRKRYEFQLSEDWRFEINLNQIQIFRFGFMFAPAAIHLSLGRLWFSLVNEEVLKLTDKIIRMEHQRELKDGKAEE